MKPWGSIYDIADVHLRRLLCATGFRNKIAEIAVEVRAGQEILNGDVHPPPPVMAGVGRDVDSLILRFTLITYLAVNRHPILNRKYT